MTEQETAAIRELRDTVQALAVRLEHVENMLSGPPPIVSVVREHDKILAVSASEVKSMRDDLGEIKDTLKWVVRLAIGALILGIIGYALQGGFVVAP